MITNKNLIAGALVSGEGDVSRLVNPCTGEVYTEINAASSEQVLATIDASRAAFESWSQTTPAERSAMLLALADAVEANKERFAKLESLNCGKPYLSVLNDEMPLTIDVFRFMAGAARCITGTNAGEYVKSFTSMIRRDPIGVVGSIAPWNYPLMMAAWKMAPALAAGCTVVLKPSEITPLTTMLLGELAADIFPKGVVSIVVGSGATVGDVLIHSQKLDYVSLTGGPSTASRILQAASTHLFHTHLELGGKAPVIVFDDADQQKVINTIRAASFFNAGQDCAQPCRLYVEDGIYDRFVADLAASVSSIRVGGPEMSDVEMGPVISERHLAHVAGFVDRAKAHAHLEVVAGGYQLDRAGFFFAPTVIANAQQKDEVVQSEIFGPVISVTRFSGAEQAIQYANDSEYGLASSIWTSQIGKGMKVASKLRNGITWMNTHGVATAEMPHGGMKASGYGSDMSVFALEGYTTVRHVQIAHD